MVVVGFPAAKMPCQGLYVASSEDPRGWGLIFPNIGLCHALHLSIGYIREHLMPLWCLQGHLLPPLRFLEGGGTCHMILDSAGICCLISCFLRVRHLLAHVGLCHVVWGSGGHCRHPLGTPGWVGHWQGHLVPYLGVVWHWRMLKQGLLPLEGLYYHYPPYFGQHKLIEELGN